MPFKKKACEDPLNKCKLPPPRAGEGQEQVYKEGTGQYYWQKCTEKKKSQITCFLSGKGLCFNNPGQNLVKLWEMSQFINIAVTNIPSLIQHDYIQHDYS